jgi:hypothetical protein
VSVRACQNLGSSADGLLRPAGGCLHCRATLLAAGTPWLRGAFLFLVAGLHNGAEWPCPFVACAYPTRPRGSLASLGGRSVGEGRRCHRPTSPRSLISIAVLYDDLAIGRNHCAHGPPKWGWPSQPASPRCRPHRNQETSQPVRQWEYLKLDLNHTPRRGDPIDVLNKGLMAGNS